MRIDKTKTNKSSKNGAKIFEFQGKTVNETDQETPIKHDKRETEKS